MSEKVTRIGAHLRDAGRPGRTAGGGHLPEDCPVTPLGKNGLLCHYLDAAGSYVQLEAKAHSKNTLYGLFGQSASFMVGPLAWAKGFDEKTRRPKDFAPDKVARDLIAACDAEGPFPGPECLRGNGAWAGEDGALLVHCGDVVMNGRVVERPGKRERHIYVRRPARTRPATLAQPPGDEGPGAELLTLLRCWRWRRDDLAPQLMAGAIGAAWLCGALEVRPQVWITGERGSGKSTLMKRLLAHVLHEGESCIVTDDPTPAGVRSRMQQDSIALIYDEAEPSEDNTKLNGVIELARSAFSGGSSLRSTSDHGNVMHAIRFAGFFSSILRPSFKTQDLSRIASFVLLKNPSGRAPVMAPETLRLLGRRIHRRMIDQWPAFQERLGAWRDAVIAAGLDGRGADLYGTLLAAQDVLLHDQAPDSDTLAETAERIAEATRADRMEEEPEWSRCLGHLRTSPAPQWRGGQQGDIGAIIAQAADRPVLVDGEGGLRKATAQERADADRALGALGLRVVLARSEAGHPILERGLWVGHLAVANSHATLAGIFNRTPWAARAGAAGAWKAALEETPGAKLGKEMRFGGGTSRCVLVPLEHVLGAAMEGEA